MQFDASSDIIEAHITDHNPGFMIVHCKQQQTVSRKQSRDHSENILLQTFKEFDLVLVEVPNSESTM